MGTLNSDTGTSLLAAIECSAKTDIGMRREENQDSYGIVESSEFRFFIVADGMGGVKGGALASQMAVAHVKETLSSEARVTPELLSSSVEGANLAIHQKGNEDRSFQGMGTTFVGLCFQDDSFFVVNVGDSRAYRVRHGEILQLTEDHTLVNELVKSGALTPDQVEGHPISHMLTRSLGPLDNVDVDCDPAEAIPCAGDKYLLCSDGLYGLVDDNEIRDHLLNLPLAEAVDSLIALANSRGGTDNITIIGLQLGDAFPEATAEQPASAPEAEVAAAVESADPAQEVPPVADPTPDGESADVMATQPFEFSTDTPSESKEASDAVAVDETKEAAEVEPQAEATSGQAADALLLASDDSDDDELTAAHQTLEFSSLSEEEVESLEVTGDSESPAPEQAPAEQTAAPAIESQNPETKSQPVEELFTEQEKGRGGILKWGAIAIGGVFGVLFLGGYLQGGHSPREMVHRAGSLIETAKQLPISSEQKDAVDTAAPQSAPTALLPEAQVDVPTKSGQQLPPTPVPAPAFQEMEPVESDPAPEVPELDSPEYGEEVIEVAESVATGSVSEVEETIAESAEPIQEQGVQARSGAEVDQIGDPIPPPIVEGPGEGVELEESPEETASYERDAAEAIGSPVELEGEKPEVVEAAERAETTPQQNLDEDPDTLRLRQVRKEMEWVKARVTLLRVPTSPNVRQELTSEARHAESLAEQYERELETIELQAIEAEREIRFWMRLQDKLEVIDPRGYSSKDVQALAVAALAAERSPEIAEAYDRYRVVEADYRDSLETDPQGDIKEARAARSVLDQERRRAREKVTTMVPEVVTGTIDRLTETMGSKEARQLALRARLAQAREDASFYDALLSGDEERKEQFRQKLGARYRKLEAEKDRLEPRG